MNDNTHDSRLIDLFLRLVSCDSPSYGEDAVRDAVMAELADMGIKAEEDGAGKLIGGSCGNLYAYVEGDPSLEPVLFSSHLDTVEPSRGKKAVIHDDGLITSAGDTVLGADDAGGLASILHALRLTLESGERHRPIELVFDVCEERYCVGIQKFDYGRVKSKQVYVLDLDGRVGSAASAAPSIVQWKAKFIGRAAHAGFSPEEGLHAIKAAAEGISNLRCGRVDGMTVNVGTIKGGIADNIVAPECLVTGEVRGYDKDLVSGKIDEIGEIMRSAAENAGMVCDFAVDIICEAYRTDESAPSRRRYAEACRAAGVEPEFKVTGGASTNNHWAAWGFDGLVISCAMNNCHSVKEWSSVSELEKSCAIVRELMR